MTLLWLLPVLTLIVGAALIRTWRLPAPALAIGLGLLGVGAVISAAASPFAAASLARTWPTAGGAALAIVLHHLWSSQTPRRLGLFFAGAGALLNFVAFVGWWGGTWPLPWDVRNGIPFGHSTYTGGAVVLFLPWIALETSRSRGLARAGWSASAAVGLLVVASTSSRGSALALAVMATIAGLLVVVFGNWSRRRKLALLACLAGTSALLVAANPRLRDLIVHRHWGEGAEESNLQRRAMIKAGLLLGRERPLLGWGPGTVPLAYPRVRAELDGGVDNVLQLHSTPAQVWATTGALGVVAGLLILVGVSTAAFHARRRPEALTATASLAGSALVSLTDHQLDLPIFTVVAATQVALLSAAAAGRREGRTHGTRLRWSAVFALLAVIAWAIPATARDLWARLAYENALTALEHDDVPAFRAAIDRATSIAPHDPFFDHHYAGQAIVSRFTTRDSTQRAALTNIAIRRLERSLTTEAHQEFAHFNLGWLYLNQSRPSAAARHCAAAAQLVPDKGGVYFGLGLALLEAGRIDHAVRAFALEWINDPRSVTSAAWEVPTLAAHVPAVREETLRLLEGLRTQHAQAAVVQTWIHWWQDGSARDAALLRPHNTESARFLESLPKIQSRQPLGTEVAGYRWAHAYSAWLAKSDTSGFLLIASGDRDYAAALARRARAHAGDFRAFLAAPTGDEPALIRSYRRDRPGYGVLALHPEGPPLTDNYLVQENRVTANFASGLFPRKGWLPGRFLLALLPELPR